MVVVIDRLEHCEYSSPTTLSGLSAKYITIPSSIILDKEMDAKRVAVFSYFRVRKGYDEKIEFSIPSIVKWSGCKPDTRSDGISKKFMDVVTALKDRGYLTYSEELHKVAYTTGEFNTEKVFDECQTESFAVVYLDELYKILEYKKDNNKDAFLNNTVLLLVFAFFRNAIFRRLNKLKPEEVNIDNLNSHIHDVESRRSLYPEAYADKYSEISKKIGVTPRTISKAVDILEELGLLVTDSAYRIHDEDGKYNTQDTIFANAYKREGNTLLDAGEEYYRREIENKTKIIQKFSERFMIDKRKRKTTKGGK